VGGEFAIALLALALALRTRRKSHWSLGHRSPSRERRARPGLSLGPCREAYPILMDELPGTRAMIKFKLIMVFVTYEITDLVLNAARAAGATGATIIKNARGQGLERRTTFLGLEYLAPRDVILILAESRRSEKIMQAVTKAGALDERLDTGLALELDVSRALGLTEHIKALAAEKPLEEKF